MYGDIGTSPLYALKTALAHAQGTGATQGEVVGVVSLLIYALFFIVTIKYVLFLMRADNKGEGGTLSLMALAQKALGRRATPVFILGVAGAALFSGDAIITPAISVLSAVEGLGVAQKELSAYVLPITVVILISLFTVESVGTARVGAVFGPMMVVFVGLMGLLGVWYRDALGFATQAVIPYDQRLGRFSAYLQQLDMESNGKGVRLDGDPVHFPTGPVVWGEPGTNGQHAFFQLLHQGTEVVPVDFLVAAEPTRADRHHHDLLLANCFAQSQALMQGRDLAEVTTQLEKGGMAPDAVKALAPHKVFSGNRPSSTFLYRKLDPAMLGRLIALYEHRVFTMAAIWDTNPFDQWGVELGKELASKLAPIVADIDAPTDGLDASTAGLVAHRRALLIKPALAG